MFEIIFLIFLIVCASLAYFIRRKRVDFTSGEEFDILEEGEDQDP